MADPVVLISKSHAEARWACERKEYYSYFFGGTGLRPLAPSFDYGFGIILHDAVAQIARTVGMPDPIPTIAPNVFERVYQLCQSCQMDDATSKQWGTIGEGLIRAFYKRRWPEILRQYEIVHIEANCVTPLGEGIWFVAKPDLILKDRFTGAYVYWEYKTTGWIDTKWLNSWNKAVQVHSGLKAASHTLGLPIEDCIIEGLYKGRRQYEYQSENSYQSSPFAWGWQREGVAGVLADQYAYTSMRGKGWQRFPTYQLVDGLGPWVDEMPTELIDKQFVRTPPITINEDIVSDFFEQTRWRVREVRAANREFAELMTGVQNLADQQIRLREILNHYFPQDFGACEPAMGHPCEFKDMCWNSSVRRDPLGSGQYRRRQLEHQEEFIKLLPVEDAA